MQEIIFYNGFNLLVDIVIGITVGLLAYKTGIRTGYLKGYGEGQEDLRQYQEDSAEYWLQSERESRHGE